MRNIKLMIQYDGTKYRGWQKLGDSDKTIQGKIEAVLNKMTGEEITLIGSGRTDAGVHAVKQIANFHTKSELKTGEIQDYCYNYLPRDIVVRQVSNADAKFHARFLAKSKTYLYKIDNKKYHNPLLEKYATHIPQKLNLEVMEKAINHFIGEHDFTSFTTAKSKNKSMIKKINYIKLYEEDGLINLMINGDSFLYNMIRIIAGTLIEVGLGEKKPDQINSIFKAKKREKAGYTALAKGLYLYDVEY